MQANDSTSIIEDTSANEQYDMIVPNGDARLRGISQYQQSSIGSQYDHSQILDGKVFISGGMFDLTDRSVGSPLASLEMSRINDISASKTNTNASRDNLVPSGDSLIMNRKDLFRKQRDHLREQTGNDILVKE